MYQRVAPFVGNKVKALWTEIYSALKDPREKTDHYASEYELRQRMRACNTCHQLTTAHGGGCLLSTGDCVACLSNREAVRDAVAWKGAVCPLGIWGKKEEDERSQVLDDSSGSGFKVPVQ